MFRRWIWIGILVLMGTPLWAQAPRAIKRDRGEMASVQRVALVIGNGAYTGSVSSLRNPVNDARGMAQALRNIGFEVISLYDANRADMGEAVHEFSERISSTGVALFYFAGHGLQVDGMNYLVPIDANIQKEFQVKYQCNSANEILDMMEEKQGNRINVVILDACRANPFKTRSISGRGLAAMPSSSGSLIAYAAAAGNVAEDGTGRHSPYTKSLIKHIQTPGLELEDVFKAVGKDVLRATNNAQNPGRYSNLNEDYYLVVSESSTLEPLPPGPGGRTQLPTNPVPDLQTGFESPVPIVGDSRRFSLPNGESMVFVWIPSGTFMMGSPDSEAGRYTDEGPVHRVTISKGFYLGKYEVTQGQWEAVMGTTPWRGKANVRSGSDYPSVYVSWDDAQEFISRLNAMSGSELYRLPIEAEWEYACRAGTTTRWSFGDNTSQLMHYAWYRDNAWDVGETYGHRIGTKRPNAWGLYDMYGNVWEWVGDWYDADYYSRSSLVDPSGPAMGSYRVLRGGDFNDTDGRVVRSARRDYHSPGYRNGGIGFRLLRRVD